MKTCTKCGEEKPLTEFWNDRRRIGGKMARCKPCKTADHLGYSRLGAYNKRRYWKNPAGERNRHLRRKYGISECDYQSLLEKQERRCAICRRGQLRAFDVDHDHATGQLRGLLCTNCNRMLGHAGDSPKRLRSAVKYLASFRKSRRRSSNPT